MKYEITREAKIEGIGNLYSLDVGMPLDDFLEVASEDKIPSIRQMAYARISNPELADKAVSVREGVIYTQNRLPIMTLNAPFLQEPRKATNAHRNDVEYEVDASSFIKLASKQASLGPLEREVFFVPKSSDFAIPRKAMLDLLPKKVRDHYVNTGVDSLNLQACISESLKYISDAENMKKQDPLVQFAVSLFKDVSIAYALFNPKDTIVKLVEKDFVKKKEKPFVREVFFEQLKHSSAIEGEFRSLKQKKKRYYLI